MKYGNFAFFRRWWKKVCQELRCSPNLYSSDLLGQIYRQHRPVHYSPSSHSALAEAELEYKDDHVSHSVYVKFDLDSESTLNNLALEQLVGRELVQLLVWTTTPWTLTANMVRLSLRLTKKNLP
jgi:isoleucyl-tRNA synthetase